MSSPPPTSSQASVDTTYAEEDLAERIASSKSDKAQGKSEGATPKVAAASTSSAKTGEKRQRNITDMFKVTPAAKKIRVSATIAAAVAGASSPLSSPPGTPRASAPRLVNGLMPLNFVPFNAQTYNEQLSAEEKQLLKLECDTMGKSWVSLGLV